LEQKLVDRFFEGELASKDMTYVSNARHIDLLEQSKSALEDAMEGIELGVPMDMVQIDVTRTWEYLGEIIGDTASEGLIRSEEHTSELQSRFDLVCRLL